jgi:hypothetical protein
LFGFSATFFEPVLGTRGMGEAGDFRVGWGFVIRYFVESKKACFVFMIARAFD